VNKNIEEKVISDFGREWTSFDQVELSEKELFNTFQKYFSIFPFGEISTDAEGFDMGCGSGRWARFIAPVVGKLHCIEPSAQACEVAKKNLCSFENCFFYHATVDKISLPENSMDFGYCLGVLHHVSKTQNGINKCVTLLKPGAPFLLYLYYAFDNKPAWFRVIWKTSDILRKAVCIMPYPIKYLLCQLIALFVYFPLARTALLLEQSSLKITNFPLSSYRNKSFYTMRTDALDRFGTRLEKRFTQVQIKEMMVEAGLENIVFNQQEPYWCAVGYKPQPCI